MTRIVRTDYHHKRPTQRQPVERRDNKPLQPSRHPISSLALCAMGTLAPDRTSLLPVGQHTWLPCLITPPAPRPTAAFLFEKPGAKTDKKNGSGLLSVCNDDPTTEVTHHFLVGQKRKGRGAV